MNSANEYLLTKKEPIFVAVSKLLSSKLAVFRVCTVFGSLRTKIRAVPNSWTVHSNLLAMGDRAVIHPDRISVVCHDRPRPSDHS